MRRRDIPDYPWASAASLHHNPQVLCRSLVWTSFPGEHLALRYGAELVMARQYEGKASHKSLRQLPRHFLTLVRRFNVADEDEICMQKIWMRYIFHFISSGGYRVFDFHVSLFYSYSLFYQWGLKCACKEYKCIIHSNFIMYHRVFASVCHHHHFTIHSVFTNSPSLHLTIFSHHPSAVSFSFDLN